MYSAVPNDAMYMAGTMYSSAGYASAPAPFPTCACLKYSITATVTTSDSAYITHAVWKYGLRHCADAVVSTRCTHRRTAGTR